MDVAVELSLLQKRFTGAGIEGYGTLRSGKYMVTVHMDVCDSTSYICRPVCVGASARRDIYTYRTVLGTPQFALSLSHSPTQTRLLVAFNSAFPPVRVRMCTEDGCAHVRRKAFSDGQSTAVRIYVVSSTYVHTYCIPTSPPPHTHTHTSIIIQFPLNKDTSEAAGLRLLLIRR